MWNDPGSAAPIKFIGNTGIPMVVGGAVIGGTCAYRCSIDGCWLLSAVDAFIYSRMERSTRIFQGFAVKHFKPGTSTWAKPTLGFAGMTAERVKRIPPG